MTCFASSHGIQPLKINDKNKYILFCKGALSYVLRGEKIFSRGQSSDPIFNIILLEKRKLHLDLLPQVVYILKHPAFSWISTSVPPQCRWLYCFFWYFLIRLGKMWSSCTLGQGRKYKFLPEVFVLYTQDLGEIRHTL